MSKEKSILESHTAGPQSVGYDYQFYYFMFLLLELDLGESIGFEVKDDIHIEKSNGTCILFQMKHSTITSSAGLIQNLTTLDVDLWKSLSNWTDIIKHRPSKSGFPVELSFRLVTNKNEGNNEFIDALYKFKSDEDVDKILIGLKDLQSKTADKTIKKYIKNICTLGKKKLSEFLKRLTIETSVDDVIQKIKLRIQYIVKQPNLVEPIFEKLSANIHLAKYIDIKERKAFYITIDDFNRRFGKCFQVAFETKPLPKRALPVLLPENLEEQIFIKQLIDIGEVKPGSSDIRNYTYQMLKFLNDFTYWSAESILQMTDMDEFKKGSILQWYNEFKSKYRSIERQLENGEQMAKLEEQIKDLGVKIVDYLRKQNLSFPGYSPLGIEASNGHYYALSNNPEIGWHFDWENKYKNK